MPPINSDDLPGTPDDFVDNMSLDELAAQTAGGTNFDLRGLERLGLPAWRMTDGPNGARGTSILGSGPAKALCIPSGSALGATWNPALIEELGAALGDETRTKQARVLLAPTVNLHRSPLGGRNFECYSEDPLLSGKAAAAFVRGVQSRGVATTVKHFVGNDAETERNTMNSVIDERTLRELYLVPFELAVKEGGALGIMTGYNRLNGEYCTEQAWLLRDILRDEWGFEGFVVTDWFSAGETVTSALAGVDIEMPAGDRIYGVPLAAAVRDGRIEQSVVAEMVRRRLRVFEKLGALHDEPHPEHNIDRPEHRVLARRASAESIVLLRNEADAESAVLPLDPGAVRTLALIGPNAARGQIMGGGSANIRPHHRTSPLDAIRSAFAGAEILYEPGCSIDRSAPVLTGSQIAGGQFRVEVFSSKDWSGEPAGVTTRDTSRILFMDEIVPGVLSFSFSAIASATWTPDVSGTHVFEFTQLTPSRVTVDGQPIFDGLTTPPPHGTRFFGFGSTTVDFPFEAEAGRSYNLVVETRSGAGPFGGIEVGCRPPLPADSIKRAVAAAQAADRVVVIVGTNDDWETEGEDRTSMDLPGDQNALVEAVLAVRPDAVIVLNSGSPVTLPWVEQSRALLQIWFGGQEMGLALADVLTGVSEPGGRLPTTFPIRLEHNPSFGNFPGSNGEVRYGEGILVGYRWYDTRHLPVRFAFGHGLSYTTFDISAPELSAHTFTPGSTLTVRVRVTNTGSRPGSQVVQCYVAPPMSRLERPAKELRGFAKVALEPGEAQDVTITLDDRSFAYWDPAEPGWPVLQAHLSPTLPQLARAMRRTSPGWVVEPGNYDILIAISAAEVIHRASLEVVAS